MTRTQKVQIEKFSLINHIGNYSTSWPNKPVQAGAITLLLAGQNPLEKEGEGGHYVILEVSKTLKVGYTRLIGTPAGVRSPAGAKDFSSSL
jgi:hypothetical protein